MKSNTPTHFQVSSYDDYFNVETMLSSLPSNIKVEAIQEITDIAGVIVGVVYTGEIDDPHNKEFVENLIDYYKIYYKIEK